MRRSLHNAAVVCHTSSTNLTVVGVHSDAGAISFFRRSRNCTAISAACGAGVSASLFPSSTAAGMIKAEWRQITSSWIQDEQDLASRRPVISPRDILMNLRILTRPATFFNAHSTYDQLGVRVCTIMGVASA